MRTVINPPSVVTLLAGWVRGGISVALSFALMWVLSLLVFRGFFGSFLPFLIVGAVGWTGVVILGSLFEHTLTIEANELVVRTWIGAVLRRPGRRFPLQQPRLSLAPRSGRGGGGLRSKRLWLIDSNGREHSFAFTLLSYDALAGQLAESSLGRGGVPRY
ncbi:MAG TPA: hypothetical protein VJ872_04035 [Nocardioides sp.]|nr:hypothetical protein [Nocardioides sp.]